MRQNNLWRKIWPKPVSPRAIRIYKEYSDFCAVVSDKDELLAVTLERALELISANIGSILMLDGPRREHFTIRATIGLGDKVNIGDVIPYETGIAKYAVINKAPVLVKDISKDSRFGRTSRQKTYGTASFILMPIKTSKDIFGVLTTSRKNENRIFTTGDVDILIPLINMAGIVYENLDFFAKVQARDQELSIIQQVGGALSSSTFDIGKVLTYTMDLIHSVMNVEAGALFLVSNGSLKFATAFNMDNENLSNVRINFGQGIVGHVAARGQSLVVNDFREFQNFFSEVDEFTGFKAHSALCVPMISMGRVTGVIEVLNKSNGGFSPKDMDLLKSIASSMSIALENARLYEETVAMAETERGIRQVFQKFVPKKVIEQILYAEKTHNATLEEIKTLTLLNIDIRDFSILTRDIGPQKTIPLLNRFFKTMGEAVFNHGGIVDKYLGDGFLAVFGAPVSTPRDADNAISAALEMQASLPKLNKQLKRETDTEIRMGISIHTGEVVVGNVGFDMKMDYTVIGDSVNTVFRLQDLTKTIPNGILISDHTRRAAQAPLKLIKFSGEHSISDHHGEIRTFELGR